MGKRVSAYYFFVCWQWIGIQNPMLFFFVPFKRKRCTKCPWNWFLIEMCGMCGTCFIAIFEIGGNPISQSTIFCVEKKYQWNQFKFYFQKRSFPLLLITVELNSDHIKFNLKWIFDDWRVTNRIQNFTLFFTLHVYLFKFDAIFKRNASFIQPNRKTR